MPHLHHLRISLRDPRGQTMAEYGVLLALVVTVAMVTLVVFGSTVGRLWTEFNTAFGG
jgi:Flp pilus assembly pilin Flp